MLWRLGPPIRRRRALFVSDPVGNPLSSGSLFEGTGQIRIQFLGWFSAPGLVHRALREVHDSLTLLPIYAPSSQPGWRVAFISLPASTSQRILAFSGLFRARCILSCSGWVFPSHTTPTHSSADGRAFVACGPARVKPAHPAEPPQSAGFRFARSENFLAGSHLIGSFFAADPEATSVSRE